MNTEIIRSADSRKETFWLLVATALILGVCTLLILGRQRDSETRELQEAQISVFNDLNNREQGTYNDLLSAVEEIEMIHGEAGETEWPTVETLEEEWISPFVRDTAWEARGALEWAQTAMPTNIQGKEEVCAYFGRPEDPSKSGAFLLLLYSDHEDEESHAIWYSPAGESDFPESFKLSSLVINGWFEAVPYTGEEELKRLKG